MESSEKIRLLQFFICKEFLSSKEPDSYTARSVLSNLVVPYFPYALDELYAVTCWRKDERFHKEVIEYAVNDEKKYRTPPMDIEPVKGSVLLRWHKHRFPSDFAIEKSILLTVRVVLDWKVCFETYIMVEGKA